MSSFAVIVAALGLLLISANSPNAVPEGKTLTSVSTISGGSPGSAGGFGRLIQTPTDPFNVM